MLTSVNTGEQTAEETIGRLSMLQICIDVALQMQDVLKELLVQTTNLFGRCFC